MRRKNDRPTVIYWLFDMRPEMLGDRGLGTPFYCGKTVNDLNERLYGHKHDATRHLNRPTAVRVNACAGQIRIQQMATIAAGEDWIAAEKLWIGTLRLLYPNSATNTTAGGQGAPGLVHSVTTRQKISAAKQGKPKTEEHRAKLRAANLGKKLSDETRAKMRIRMLGSTQSPESRRKTSEGRKGIVFSADHRAKMSKALTGKRLSPEHKANISKGLRRRAGSVG